VFLRNDIHPIRCYQILLLHIPKGVVPYMSNPLCLADFFLKSYDRGSITLSVLSLSGLFYLLTKHRLGDPESISPTCSRFYVRLNDLIQPAVFSLALRARFMRLLHASLSSPMLPTNLVACFIKRCVRVACLVPPPSAMWLLALSHSILIKNPTCSSLVSVDGSTASNNISPFGDQFDINLLQLTHGEVTEPPAGETLNEGTIDLSTCSTVLARKSLWELELLKRHYSPYVSQIAQLFDTNFFEASAKRLDIDDFLTVKQSRLFQQELKRQKTGNACAVGSHRTTPADAEKLFTMGLALRQDSD